MQEDSFSELSQQMPQIDRREEVVPTFSYSGSSDIIHQRLISENRYEEYKKGLLETIYVNGYSDQYFAEYINETLGKNNFKLFVESELFAKENELLYSNTFKDMGRDKTFLYLSRDSKHFMAVRAIKDGDTMKLYVVNSSPKTAYLPKEDDEIIKRMSMEASVKSIVAREIKPAIYQLGNFACFTYALKNAKELSGMSEHELDSVLEEKIDRKEAVDENLFSISSYSLFKGMLDAMSSSQNFKMHSNLNEDDAIRATISYMKTGEEMLGSISIFTPISFDKTRLIRLNQLRSQRKEKYFFPGAQVKSSIPEQSSLTVQRSNGNRSLQ